MCEEGIERVTVNDSKDKYVPNVKIKVGPKVDPQEQHMKKQIQQRAAGERYEGSGVGKAECAHPSSHIVLEMKRQQMKRPEAPELEAPLRVPFFDRG